MTSSILRFDLSNPCCNLKNAQRLKHPTKVRLQRRIPIPSDLVIGNITCVLFLVLCLNKFSELSLRSYKVCPIITWNFFGSSPCGYHSAESIQEICGAKKCACVVLVFFVFFVFCFLFFVFFYLKGEW